MKVQVLAIEGIYNYMQKICFL